MPEQFDPAWEYYEGNSEIEELIYGEKKQSVSLHSVVTFERGSNQSRVEGFRITKGNGLNILPMKMGRMRIDNRSNCLLEKRQCLNTKCRELFYPRLREGVIQSYCGIQCIPKPGRPKTLPLSAICPYCSNTFKPNCRIHRYCSTQCANLHRVRMMVEQYDTQRRQERLELMERTCSNVIECLGCGGPVIRDKIGKCGRGKDKIYCNEACRRRIKNRMYWQRRNERRNIVNIA